MPTIQINKTAFDFHNTELTIVGATGVLGIVDGLEAISWKAKFERQGMYGNNRLVQAWTDGEASYEGGLTVQQYWWNYVVDFTNANNLARATMEMTLAMTFYKVGVPMASVTFEKARFKGFSPDYKRGADTLTVPVDLEMVNVFQNGFDDFLGRMQ